LGRGWVNINGHPFILGNYTGISGYHNNYNAMINFDSAIDNLLVNMGL